MAESVEDEFDEIEEELGLAPAKTDSEQLDAIRKGVKSTNYLLKQLTGWMLALTIFLILSISALLIKLVFFP